MLFSPRVGLKELSGLSRRLATAIEGGVDIRQVLAREAGGGKSGSLRKRLRVIQEALDRGESLADALQLTDDYFPPFFREMVAVGEEAGKLPEVLRHLAEHYEHHLKLRGIFLLGIAWPTLQLVAAIVIIGLLILALGVVGSYTGTTTDILGFGLVGVKGFIIYACFVGGIVAALFFTLQAAQRGKLWTKPLQKLTLRVPVLGKALETLAISRFAWSLRATFDTGMPADRAVSLSLRTMQNARYVDLIDDVAREIRQGREISQTLRGTDAFPNEFLDILEVAEHSGRLPESMALTAQQYQEQAQRAFAALTVVLGFVVWAGVAVVIIIMIFRLAFFYINTINDAANGKF